MKQLFLAAAVMLAPFATQAESARDIVIAGVTAVFIEPDVTAIDRLFREDYIQHNPNFPNGLDTLRGFASAPAEGFTYEIGKIIADEDAQLVAVHFRATGWGPDPMVGVDIFRVEDGQIAEHWDVMQAEVQDTASGNPMWTPAQ
ncbi:nuclear transport factor 2 family protein [Celeribacter sp. PS-C1]|uniref:nuclear transport factor 2 family protein n=1 Tax=Celeribacter sp. PS-C1 TaxID=2820813 RepID=UPI001CA5C3C6|nr:nuclear transport factor 2 family protein [Celeribacter sp. PS-C1]MBW6416737.1 nuclear transport factor 2 family protein [Celeribacter sp. PS-C1]